MNVEHVLIEKSFELIKEAELIATGKSIKNKQRIAGEIRKAKTLLTWHKHFIYYFPEYFEEIQFEYWKNNKAEMISSINA